MPTPTFPLMIGDQELRAIGHVAAQWAHLEVQIDAITQILCNQPSVLESGLRQEQSFKKRMANLRKAASIALRDHEPVRVEIEQIANEASSLRGLRDEIVHGCWRYVETNREKNGIPQVGTGVDLIRQYPSFRSRTRPITAERAETIACKISELNFRLVMWSVANIPTAPQNNG
jgi:hypothetical protein